MKIQKKEIIFFPPRIPLDPTLLYNIEIQLTW